LGRSGYDIEGATDPVKAVDLVRDNKYDMLLLDFIMTPIHGNEVVERIRRFNKELYILLLTGHKDLAPPLETIRQLDIQGYCEKSDRFDQLLLLVDSGIKSITQMHVISRYKDGQDAIATHYVTTGVNDKSWNFTGIASYYSDKYLLELSGDKLTHSAFTLTGEPTGLLSSPLKVEGIARDKNNNLYLGTTNYVYKYDKVSNPVEGFEKSKISKLVNCMATDQDGKIWVGTVKGLACYNGSNFTYFDKSKSLPGNIILSILTDSKNRKWIGTYNGVLCIENEKETIYDKKTGLSSNRIMALAENSSGTVFIASSNMYTVCYSLNYEVNGSMKEEPLPKPEKVYTMVFDKNDNLWIGCQGCLLCRNNKGEYKVYNKDNSPIDPTYNLDKLFVIGNEIWLSVNIPIQDNTTHSSMSPVTKDGPSAKELEALNNLKPKLQGIQPSELVLIFQPAAQ
jgi:ligand-binding sensor domain-containing protein